MRKLFVVLALLASSSAQAGRGATYESIMDAISSDNADVIASELERAERLVCARCVGPILELLDHRDYRVREVAGWWLARRPVLSAAVTMQSIARMQGNDPVAAEYAADVVGSMRHTDVVPILASMLTRPDFPAATKVAAVRAIGLIGDASGLPAVVGTLGDAAPEARAEAVRAYDALRGARTGAELAPLLGDADTAVRRVTTATIARFGVAGARATLEGLLLGDTDPIVRRNAAFALLKLGDPASYSALSRAAAEDPIAFVRSTAKAALAGR
jgi:HEAT repeat protein